MKKGFLKAIVISVAIVSTVAGTFNSSAATSLTIATQTERIADVENVNYNGEKCENLGGLSVTSNDSKNRMYVVKSSNAENETVLYFYKNYNDTSDYGTIELSGAIAGHANAMAIDDNYIYIAAWHYNSGYDSAKNDIVRISRNTIWSLYNGTSGTAKGKLTSSSSGVTTFSAVKYENGTYVDYDVAITAITNYKENGQFIINYLGGQSSDETGVLKFTTASISSGRFVVSTSASDVFTVQTGLTNTTSQDIGYDSSCGLFIPRWLPAESDGSRVKNSIVWVKLNSLSGSNRVYNKDNSQFRIITVNKSASIFVNYEIESISISAENEMYAGINTVTVSDSSKYNVDGIIKIKRKTATSGGSYKFLGSNIDE